MRRYFRPLWLCAALALQAQNSAAGTRDSAGACRHEYNLASDGRDFLLAEARNSNYFLLGNSTAKMKSRAAPRDLARDVEGRLSSRCAEISPWAADQLQTFPQAKDLPSRPLDQKPGRRRSFPSHRTAPRSSGDAIWKKYGWSLSSASSQG